MTPYLNPAQITSGTLAYSFGCGKAIVSTPYWHAEELLAEGRGVLVPFADSAALAREIRDLLRDDERRLAMCRTAYELGREMVWKRSADHYVQTFQRARPGRQAQRFKPLAVRTLAERRDDLPDWRLDHLSRMTDATGIFQHGFDPTDPSAIDVWVAEPLGNLACKLGRQSGLGVLAGPGIAVHGVAVFKPNR